MTFPLEGRTVLVPVTKERRELAHLVRGLGAHVVEVECIAIEPPQDVQALSDAASRWLDGHYDWMAVTSRNAVRALAAAAAEAGSELSQGRGKVAAVGVATTRACQQVGVDVHLTPVQADAAGLVAEFPSGAGKVLAPVGNLAPAVLQTGLSRKGWNVDMVEAYRTVDGPGLDERTAERLTQGDFDAVVLTSASVARKVRRDLGEASMAAGTAIVAIGSTTAAAAIAEGLRPTAVSATASHTGILETLVQVL